MANNMTYLDFEQPIADLQKKIEELRFMTGGSELNLTDEISRLESKIGEATKSIFANLTPWQIAQLARHPQRPYALDYVHGVFTEWEELHGDRHYADDPAIVSGVARLEGRAVVVIGPDTPTEDELGQPLADPGPRRVGRIRAGSLDELMAAQREVQRFLAHWPPLQRSMAARSASEKRAGR